MSDAPESSLRLRAATADDAERLLEWRNAPEVRSASRTVHEIGQAEHERWLAETLASADRELAIVELDGRPVGQVRVDRLGPDLLELSISIERGRSGAGLGRRAIALAVESARAQSPGANVIAEIREDNDASRRAFEAAGFELAGDAEEPGFLRLRYAAG